MYRVSALLVAVTLIGTSCSGGSSASDPSEIVFALPTQLPAGWRLAWATLRVEDQFVDGEAIEVSDYTVSWRPAHRAGMNRREATGQSDDGPGMWLNLGAYYYECCYIIGERDPDEAARLADDPRDARIRTEDGTLVLEWRLGCCVPRVGGKDVTRSQLRQFAMSFRAMDRAEWKRRLGERLLIDTNNKER
jgi:hypothetical protein